MPKVLGAGFGKDFAQLSLPFILFVHWSYGDSFKIRAWKGNIEFELIAF